MENLNRALVNGAHVVARVVEFQIRQEASATSAVSLPMATSITGFPSMTLSPLSSMMGSPTDAAVSPTPTEGKKDGGGTGSSSPLLFFVALGFGVVFTNLW
ncbi:hypothetical protein RRF57_006363 [Xylaria bambusicola]|uniref:Uncharacterized protein n=1 Tax=Xylaria bambusicola TaxID=326684 RepID=A0AAN7UQ88_9PEZI